MIKNGKQIFKMQNNTRWRFAKETIYFHYFKEEA